MSNPPIPLRLFTEVACGWPSPAADYEETPLSLDELVNVTATSMHLLPADGDSMLPLIRDGDVLVVDRSAQAFLGDVVVSAIHDDFKITRLGSVEGRDALIPEDKTLSPYMLGNDELIEVWGLVVWNLRRLHRNCRQPDEPHRSLDALANVSAYSTFLVRARGDSMAPLIHDGDVLVVDKSIDAAPDDVVVAVYQGDFTVKRLGSIEGRDALIPENPAMPPLFIGGEEQVEVWGVAVWNLHRLQRNRRK